MTKLVLDEFLKEAVVGHHAVSSSPSHCIFGPIADMSVVGSFIVFDLESAFDDPETRTEAPCRRIEVECGVPIWKHGKSVFFIDRSTDTITQIFPDGEDFVYVQERRGSKPELARTMEAADWGLPSHALYDSHHSEI